MQATDIVLQMVLIFTFVTFYASVAWGLIRYSKRQGYRLWAIGWLVYTVGAIQGAFVSTEVGLAPQDVIAITAMFLGASLILDGSKMTELTKKRLQIYGLGVVLFASLVLIGVFFVLPFQYIFIPLGLHVAFVCVLSSRIIYNIESVGDSSKWWLILGFIVIAISWLTLPATLIDYSLFDYFVIFQAAGVIITGASMFTLFTSTVTKDLETQYQISQIISGLVQHDIRNYIQTARRALELTDESDLVESHWINIATEVLVDAGQFVDEMRDISVSLNQAEAPSESISLSVMIDKAKERVIKEYKLTLDQVQVDVPESIEVDNSRLLDELLWNIFDNAFKHGSPSLSVCVREFDSTDIDLVISDRGDGLPENIREFLNSSDSLSKPSKPLVGLGLHLIKGITSLRGIPLVVSDNVQDLSVIGTAYHLKLKKA
jgi:signal transduction histidine kinase